MDRAVAWMESATHLQPAAASARNIFRGCIRHFMARTAAFYSRPVGPRSFRYQIAKHVLHWLRQRGVSSVDRCCVFRPHAGSSHCTETLLRAVAWLSFLDFAASDPDGYDCRNALRSSRSLGALGVGTYPERIHCVELGGVAELSFLLHFVARRRSHRRGAWLAGIRPAYPSIALREIAVRTRQGFAASRVDLVELASASFPYTRMDNIALLDLRHHNYRALGRYYLCVQSLRRERHNSDSGAQYF